MNYSKFFNFVSVLENECFDDDFNKIYDNTLCKNKLSFNNFNQIFDDFIQLFYKHDFDDYIILFHNNEIINDVKEFINKHDFNDIIVINEIFNFLLLDENIYKKYILFWICYLNFNESKQEKIKNNELYNQINSVFNNNVLPIINMYANTKEYFYKFTYNFHELKQLNSFSSNMFDLLEFNYFNNDNYSKNIYSFNILTLLNNNNYDIILNIVNNNDGYINYKNISLLNNNENNENNDDLYILHNIFNCENNKMYEYEITNNENDYKYISSLNNTDNLIEKCLYYNKNDKYLILTGDEKFILKNLIKKHEFIKKRDEMINIYKEYCKKENIEYLNYNFFDNKNISDNTLIELNRFNENNYSYFVKELSDETKDKIINYIYTAEICKNFELVKNIVKYYNLEGKDIADTNTFYNTSKNIINYLLENKVIHEYVFKISFNHPVRELIWTNYS